MTAVDLEKRYEEYQNLPGDAEARLRQMGYTVSHPLPGSEVDSFEAFQSLVLHLEFARRGGEKMNATDLSAALKLCYKTYLKRKDILHLLKIGDSPLTEDEIQDALRLMPIDADGGILVDDLIEFMYK